MTEYAGSRNARECSFMYSSALVINGDSDAVSVQEPADDKPRGRASHTMLPSNELHGFFGTLPRPTSLMLILLSAAQGRPTSVRRPPRSYSQNVTATSCSRRRRPHPSWLGRGL